jgi:predicted nucleic acid-binding protein
LIALASTTDQWHRRAAAWARFLRGDCRFWTTDYVLLEVLDGLARPAHRSDALATHQFMSTDPKVTVISQSGDLFKRGVEFHRARPDKDWSLTDCISFVVMTDLRLQDALTADRHFEQAGFRALLRSGPPSVNGT